MHLRQAGNFMTFIRSSLKVSRDTFEKAENAFQGDL